MPRKQRPAKHHIHCEFENFTFEPLTQSQSEAKADYEDGKNLLLTGFAGTGKTHLACALGIQALERREIDRIAIFRSAVASRNIGFLPGTEQDKIAVYETAIKDIFNNLLRRGDGYELLKTKGMVKFESTSFQRGMNYHRTLVIVEEVQNLSFQEVDTLVTRLGKSSRVILAGDSRQTDLRDTGFRTMVKVVKQLEDDFSHIDFGVNDIVRSDFVRNWIIASSEVNGNPIDLD